MDNRYKIVISNKNLYKEIELTPEKDSIRVGTGIECEARLHKDLFFEPIELYFRKNENSWIVTCSDNLYFTVGDVRKLMTKSLEHGERFIVKYQESNNDVFVVDFLIDFDNRERRFERKIDVLNINQFTIGANTNSNIIIQSRYVKNDLVLLVNNGSDLRLDVKNSTYGVYHNGNKAGSNLTIENGDFFSISDFIFYYKDSCLYTEVRKDCTINGLNYKDEPTQNFYPKFTRNTRIQSVVEDTKIDILDPPSKPQKPKNNLFLSLLPSFGMLIASGAMAFAGGSMVFFSLISGAMAIVTTILGVIQGGKDYKKECKERIAKYNSYIEKKRGEIEEIRESERQQLENIYISQDLELNRIYNFSGDLFERTLKDKDFLNIRIGTGDIDAHRQINYKKQERLEIEDDLQNQPEILFNEYKMVKQAPVVCNLPANNAVGIVGIEENRFALLKNIVIDIAARHFYSEVKMFFIVEEEHTARISWLRFLPHVVDQETFTRYISCDTESKNYIFEYLYKELSVREQTKKYDEYLVIFFYDNCGFNSHPICKFIDNAKELGVTFIFFADNKYNIPIGCESIINVLDNKNGELITSQDNKITKFEYPTINDEIVSKVVEVLAPVYTEEITLEGSLTKNISLFELLKILSVEDLDLAKMWSQSEVFKSMAAPLGVSKSGLISLDLHDKAHGPHGLVAGTTGAGKSEILQTYILSMATLYHPYEVAFVIIDFKGGGMVNQFRDMPHLLGAITNIDGKAINRSLKSIKAELQKRQRLFAEAEVNHIDKYIKKFKSREVREPLPHLIIIVDEFAELKAEQPEFMKELISAARIGRSLGVHLILATQKPSGQVDEQIWSNSRFKLCLKVQNKEDSNEVLKSPLAAEIKEPGRAYLQVGNNEIFELFQSAYSGASERIDENNAREFSIFELQENGRKKSVFVKKKNKSDEQARTQLDAIVDYVSEYCENNGIKRLPNICLDALKTVINCPNDINNNNKFIDIGIYDDPDSQYQGQTLMDMNTKNTLIIGSAQTGKTNLLQCIIKEIAMMNSPAEANIYIIDFGSMVLKNFESLKHVGGVVCSSEDEKLKNLFKLLIEEIITRKEKLVSVGVSSFSAYKEAGYSDLAQIYIVIDNLTALFELYLENDDTLLNIIRDGLSVGITVIIANSQTSGISYRYMSNFSNRIVLHCNDGNEYTNLFEQVSTQPDDTPGRCIVEIDKRVLECQSYLAFEGEKEIERVHSIKELIEKINFSTVNVQAKKIPTIPNILEEEELANSYGAGRKDYSLPIGITYEEVKPFYLDFASLGAIGICGKPGKGHTNFISYMLDNFEKHSQEQPVRVCIFDDISRKYAQFKNLSIVEEYTLNVDMITEKLNEWYQILDSRYNEMLTSEEYTPQGELLVLIIQNNDVAKKIFEDMDAMNQYTEMVTRFRNLNVCVIYSNYENASVSYDAPEPLRMIKQEQHLLLLDDLDTLKVFDVPYEEIKANRKKLQLGDAYYIKDNAVTKLKVVHHTNQS